MRKTTDTVDWEEYAALSTIHLVPQVNNTMVLRHDNEFLGERQNSRSGLRVIHFCDFTVQNDPPEARTHQVLVRLGEIQMASSEIDFRGNPKRSWF